MFKRSWTKQTTFKPSHSTGSTFPVPDTRLWHQRWKSLVSSFVSGSLSHFLHALNAYKPYPRMLG
jgi:hypothetical protein